MALTGAIWAVGGGAIAGAFALGGPAVVGLWKGIAVGGAAVAAAGERAGSAIMQRQLRRMTGGEIDLADLDARGEDELVVVRGTIVVEQPLTGALVDAPGVYRRMIFEAGRKWVHEAAVDFSLVDANGEHILIQAAGSRWLTPTSERFTYPRAHFSSDRVPSRVQQLAKGRESIEAYERVLAAGTEVQVVGYKTSSADVTGQVIDYRLPPQRATLRSGANLPLVISAVADLNK